MIDFNEVIVVGRLTRDPEVTQVRGDATVCKMGIACNNKIKDKDLVDFFDVTAWNKLAEVCQKYLTKGSQILVSGRLRQEKWEKEGKSHTRVSIVASNIQFMSKGNSNSSDQGSNNNKIFQPDPFAPSAGDNPISQEDIPF